MKLINIHELNVRHWTVKAQRRQKLIHIRKSGFAIRRLLCVINNHELSVGFVISPQDGVRGVGTTYAHSDARARDLTALGILRILHI